MARVGMVGCGKLGLMVALTIESKGHEVKGFDVSDAPQRYLAEKQIPFQEEHAAELLANSKMEMVSLADLCQWADILFLAPQTPHAPEYEGTTPLPQTRADFDYSHLIECVRSVNSSLARPTPCVVISTVLPGTIEREVLPNIGENFQLIYSPQFIAMGTVYSDFLNPEFWLMGLLKYPSTVIPFEALQLTQLYTSMSDHAAFFGVLPCVMTDIRTAEGIKVLYNTFVTTKTVLANLYGELAHKCGMNVDDIFQAVSLSTRRLLSPKYLKAGMGDGGGCHPRDNIALSWLARKVGLSFDFFESLMTAREKHCEFLADIIEEQRFTHALPVILFGRSFKPETNIETGSPALLLSSILTKRGIHHGHYEMMSTPQVAGIYFIGTQHERYKSVQFPKGSVVLDPFRYLEAQEGVKLIQIGKHETLRDTRTLQPA